MFDSLEDKMRLDDAVEVTRKERIVKYSLMTLLSILIFGGLWVGLLLLEG